MWKLMLIVALLLVLTREGSGFIWERTKITNYDPWEQFQRVPPAQVTADMLMKHFLGIDHRVVRQLRKRHRHRRSVAVTQRYAQFDAIFIIDSSGSIRPRDFQKTLRALQLLTGKAENKRRYAAITFSYNATVRFNFTTRRETVNKLRKIPFEAGKTNTQDALQVCRKKLILNQESGARPGYRKRVLIVTDGHSNVDKQKTLYRAFQIKNTGTEIFVIAVGRYLKGIAEIVGLASSTDAHLYRVADTRGLLRVVKLIPPWYLIEEYIRRSWLNGMLRPQ